MANDILERLKQKRSLIQEKQKQEERRQGRLEQLKKDLKAEFDIETLEAIKNLKAEVATKLQNQKVQLDEYEKTLDDILSLAEVK